MTEYVRVPVEPLRELLNLYRDWLEDAGGCDHSVGICYCSDWELVEAIKPSLATAPQDDELARLERVAVQLRKAGATLPAPEPTGTIESAMLTGLCIALAVVESEMGSHDNANLVRLKD